MVTSLSEQGKHAKAAQAERGFVAPTNRLLGADHDSTLISTTNLAASRYWCSVKTECEQLLRETLGLTRRVLGPIHGLTQRRL